jgi:hypothetical protein
MMERIKIHKDLEYDTFIIPKGKEIIILDEGEESTTKEVKDDYAPEDPTMYRKGLKDGEERTLKKVFQYFKENIALYELQGKFERAKEEEGALTDIKARFEVSDG